MQEYLVFIEFLGETPDGKYIYRCLFSNTPDVVWGDSFNITPTGAIPNLQPYSNGINEEWRVVTDNIWDTAVSSTWFSMQDCIDGIIPLAFETQDNSEIVLPFGMRKENMENLFKANHIFYQEIDYVAKDDSDE